MWLEISNCITYGCVCVHTHRVVDKYEAKLVPLPPSLQMHTVFFPEVVPLIVSVDSFLLLSKSLCSCSCKCFVDWRLITIH